MNIGDTMTLYQDWQTNKKEIGKVILVEKVRNGYTFIVDDFLINEDFEKSYVIRIPESLTPVYNYQRWRVKFVELTPYGEQSIKIGNIKDWNIRYLDTIGVSRSSIPHDDEPEKRLIDSFIKIGDIEVF